MTEEKRKEFMEAARPLMEWLRENWHPHATAIVDSGMAELTEGVCTAHRKEWDEQGISVYDSSGQRYCIPWQKN